MKNNDRKVAGALLLAVLMTGSGMLFTAGRLHAAPKAEAQQAPAKIVNINTAASEELQTLRGVGPAIAERILQYRQEHGRFEKVEDLSNVHGIGANKLEKMKSQITV